MFYDYESVKAQAIKSIQLWLTRRSCIVFSFHSSFQISWQDRDTCLVFHQIFQLRHPISSRRNRVRIRSSLERPRCCILYLKVKFRYYFINKVQFNFLEFSWLLVTNRRNVIKFYYTIFNLKRSPLLHFDPLSSNVHPVFQRRNSTNRSAKIRNRLEHRYSDIW